MHTWKPEPARMRIRDTVSMEKIVWRLGVESGGHLWLRRHGAVEGIVEAAARAEGELGQAMRMRGGHGGGRLREELRSAQQRVLTAHAGVLQLVQGQRLLPLDGLQPLAVAVLQGTQDNIVGTACGSLWKAVHMTQVASLNALQPLAVATLQGIEKQHGLRAVQASDCGVLYTACV